MSLEELIHQFVIVKNNKPENADELLVFLQKGYIRGELDILAYRNLYRELNARGAKKA